MKDKRVGVFMQLYRNEPSMHKAIQSVLRQTYENFKYYVLVSEVTKPIVAEYAKVDNRIEIIEGKPGDNVRTYDKRITADNNAYFTIIDADDWYEESYIEDLINLAEKKDADVVACGYWFIGPGEVKYGERRQSELLWDVKETGSILPNVYMFFRTLWGKMVKSEVIQNYSQEGLPASEEYGGYGGDTITMFRWLMSAKKVAVCDKLLYNYRVSPTGGSYTLREGRLESDELLFDFVKDVLETWGEVGEEPKRFLYQVYGEALKDTTRLIMNQKATGESKAEMLLYIYEKERTKRLFERARRDMLNLQVSRVKDDYINEFYGMLFKKLNGTGITSKMVAIYMRLFEILFVKWQGMMTAKEFEILFRSGSLLDNLVNEQYQKLFSGLLDVLDNLKLEDAKVCLQLLRRVNSIPIINEFLKEKKFVLCYADIIRKLNQGERTETFSLLKACFEKDEMPYGAEQLVLLWINLAAMWEHAGEFVFAKELMVEILFRTGKKEDARKEYEELVELGIEDQNMLYLESMLSKGM